MYKTVFYSFSFFYLYHFHISSKIAGEIYMLLSYEISGLC